MPNTTASDDNEYVLCGVSLFENWNSNESQGVLESLRSEENKYRHRHRRRRRRKQQSVAGADLKQTEINYVSMREPKKILKYRGRKEVSSKIIFKMVFSSVF